MGSVVRTERGTGVADVAQVSSQMRVLLLCLHACDRRILCRWFRRCSRLTWSMRLFAVRLFSRRGSWQAMTMTARFSLLAWACLVGLLGLGACSWAEWTFEHERPARAEILLLVQLRVAICLAGSTSTPILTAFCAVMHGIHFMRFLCGNAYGLESGACEKVLRAS